MYLSLANSS